ncbi:16S rRNA (guanine(527)-N(7))-methyltransferase RsmG [Pelagicoccus mobilis]|uniref:Ribosomal RNA small subunit methyltransferase G n=1 Tax=Pelagicoccus mobilis TaxID=415221 RepID=A0A934S3W2_9BACT|nr:16S rRNA (guanine(527)-N(7))-methyltransferase RsmG [Pelagicoccus mobilis]MBK1878568.1 16S rRNA (guanine(527)-N(7))-methyltransferase RsmG [Pelagicoccus mobilis]
MKFDLSIVAQHFPEFTPDQIAKFETYASAIAEWNEKINLISRSDVENLPKRHILHSLAIAKTMAFKPDTTVIDVGTGGGFPGVPLAIAFPETRFLLVDSIGKKIKVVQDCIERLGLENAVAIQCRVEEVDRQVDFIVARAVTQLPKFMKWIRKKVKRSCFNDLPNGVLYLKGGELSEELSSIKETPEPYPIRNYFDYDEFDQKYVIHVPVKR